LTEATPKGGYNFAEEPKDDMACLMKRKIRKMQEPKDDMACLMKRKIRKMQETTACVITLHGCENELPAPYEYNKKDDDPPAEKKGIDFRADVEQPLSNKTGNTDRAVSFQYYD
jgi:hypothetical protein